jgi:sugar lactone lactonase YvrE
VLVADTGNNVVRVVFPNASVVTLAGGGGSTTSGYADALGTSALFNAPSGVAVDAQGHIYVTDTTMHLIRVIAPGTANITTLAGVPATSGGANGFGTVATFNGPKGIACDATGALYVADTGSHWIRKIA